MCALSAKRIKSNDKAFNVCGIILNVLHASLLLVQDTRAAVVCCVADLINRKVTSTRCVAISAFLRHAHSLAVTFSLLD